MRKIKKSSKIIISLICVLAVAVVGVVTGILIGKSRKKSDPPLAPAYVLTTAQKDLGKEINGTMATLVSSSKLYPLEYSSKLEDVGLDISKVSYLDQFVAWSKTQQADRSVYIAYILDDAGNPTSLLDRIIEKEFVEDYQGTPRIVFAGKNHFAVNYPMTEQTGSYVMCTVQDGDVVLNKIINYDMNSNHFRIAFDADYFVVFHQPKTDTEFKYEFFEYLTDYSDYEPFTIDVEDVNVYISCNSGVFKVDGKNVAMISEYGFSLIDSNPTTTSVDLKKGVIIQQKTEVNASVAGSEKVDEKYYTYSYILKVNGNEKAVELDGLDKIVSVAYSGEKYFGVFAKAVDDNHTLKTTGTMIYFDYNLNVIAKYDASSFSTGAVLYADNDSLLTSEGLVSGKNSTSVSNIYNFGVNKYTFVGVLSSGEFILKNEYNNLEIFNLNLERVSNFVFDEIVSYVDDNNVLCLKNGEHYLYNVKNHTASQINYTATNIASNTSVYFVSNGEDQPFTMYSGASVYQENVSEFSAGDNYLSIKLVDQTEKSYYFVDKTQLAESSPVAFSASGTAQSMSMYTPYSSGQITEDEEFDKEPEWYEYEDKVVWLQDVANNTTTVKATHCIQNGYYSLSNYIDYVEIHYNSENSGNLTGYRPYRIYYRVDVESDGNPKLVVLTEGHHNIGCLEISTYQNVTFTDEFKVALPSENGNPSKTYLIHQKYLIGSWISNNGSFDQTFKNEWLNLDNLDEASEQSYDYKVTDAGYIEYRYRYTNSTDATTGIYVHKANNGVSYDENRISKAEVYGNSIRVTFYFDFKYMAGYGFKDSDISKSVIFGHDRPIENHTTEEHDDVYYNDLYYQSVVVGYMNENVNFYSNIIQDFEFGTSSIISDNFYTNTIKGMSVNSNFQSALVYGDAAVSAQNLIATVSQKTYLAKNNEFTNLYVGNHNFKTNLVGAKLVGITTLAQPNYKDIKISDLYGTESTGSRTYKDDVIEFRTYSNVADPNDVEPEPVVSYTPLEFHKVEGEETSSYYVMQIKNADYIYVEGGLNAKRFLYCVYEPQTFYVNFDYNISGSDKSAGQEIDYLQAYAGIDIGLANQNNFMQYDKTWVYQKVSEEDFGDYNNVNGDKYYPYEFVDDETRIEIVDPTQLVEPKLTEFRQANENQAIVHEYVTEKERYFYVIIDGVRYYFQRNFMVETGVNTVTRYEKAFYGDKENPDPLTASLFVEANSVVRRLTDQPATPDYGNLITIDQNDYYEIDNTTKFFKNIYSEGVGSVYLRITKSTAADGSYVAYYYSENIHKRSGRYVGKYNFAEDGTVNTSNPLTNTKPEDYRIDEYFTFSYIDNVVITSVPQHTHYDFVGWKVIYILPSGVEHSIGVLEMTQQMIDDNGGSININTNLELLFKNQFLAGGLKDPDNVNSKTFFDYWRSIKVDKDGNETVEWFMNNMDYSVRLVAQWEPKDCTIEAIFWTESEDQTDYLGLKHAVDESGNYFLTSGFSIGVEGEGAPIFKKGNNVLDTNFDGILDPAADYTPTFKYGEFKTFGEIGEFMASKDFTQAMIDTTGLMCQFLGWAYQYSSDGTEKPGWDDGSYYSIVYGVDTEKSGEKISEYLGDTTKITIYAYYTTSMYNYFLRFHPMGGATESTENKGYYTGQQDGNGNIYNYQRKPAVYSVNVADALYSPGNNHYNHNFYSSGTENESEKLSLANGSVYAKDIMNTFTVGTSIKISVSLNTEYYIKTITINNIVLKDNENKLNYYNITFTYSVSEGHRGWSAVARSQISSDYDLVATSSSSGFVFGNNNGNINKIQFEEKDIGTGDKTLVISIGSLSHPGVMVVDSSDRRLEGNNGFTLNVYPESYTIKTETVTISAKDKYGETATGAFDYNNAMITSSQPLTNIEGKDVERGQPCYVWLGTSRYQFAQSWGEGAFESGYYLMTSDGTTVAAKMDNFTYEQFTHQELRPNGNMYVYFDAVDCMIYYPAQYSGVCDAVEYTATAKAFNQYISFEINNIPYYINSLFASSLPTGYYFAYKNDNGTQSGTCLVEEYANETFYYDGTRTKIAVYYDYERKIVKYRRVNDFEFSVGYNNTRVIAIDPDQEKIYLSNGPSSSTFSEYYDLNYYLSSIVINGITYSFNKITRDSLLRADSLSYYYGLLKSTMILKEGTAVQNTTIFNKNSDIVNNGNGSVDDLYRIKYFGDLYTIQDAYQFTLVYDDDPTGAYAGVRATDFYFFLTRNDFGFTRYFLIYDECTTEIEKINVDFIINLEFTELSREATISVTEEDLYDSNNRSFEVLYGDKLDTFAQNTVANVNNSYGFDGSLYYENIENHVPGVGETQLRHDPRTFYEFGRSGDVGKEFNNLLDEDKRDMTSMSWKNKFYFTPAQNNRFRISAKSGYIISSLKISIGNYAYTENGNTVSESFTTLIAFEFISDSLDNLYYYDTGKNYSYSSIENNMLVSYIAYKIGGNDNQTYGYKVLTNETFGLYYSNYFDANWRFGDEQTFSFDHLYLMLSGLYNDIKIEMTTTTYAEFLFESGADDANPLVTGSISGSAPVGRTDYVFIELDQTELDIYTYVYKKEENGVILPEEDRYVLTQLTKDSVDAGGNKLFNLRYYMTDSPNHIKKDTIRLTFLGTGSQIRYGLHFMATQDDYSVYFTNGRYYNEQMSSTDATPFKELEAYSGRTNSNSAITDSTRNKTDKLVYMFTGDLHQEQVVGEQLQYSGFFVNNSYIVQNESNFKFFMAVTAVVNKIGVRTDSYLYNDVLNNNVDKSTLAHTNTHQITHNPGVVVDELYKGEDYKYAFNSDRFELSLIENSMNNEYYYQLDTLHKTNSWFNDTTLSNIQLKTYLDNNVPKTWYNRITDEASEFYGESELSRVELGGLNFNWYHYDIPGYYLQFIMIKIADLNRYYMIDVPNLFIDPVNIDSGEDYLVKTIRIYNPNVVDKKGYDYRFNLYYNTDGYYSLYPVFKDEDGNIDKFASVGIMSNDINVMFISNAYKYKIQYNDYEYDNSTSGVSTHESNGFTAESVETQEIFYDSLVKLKSSKTMNGYTFIGWGSEKYFTGSNYQTRFAGGDEKTRAPIWNSTSAWFDASTFLSSAGSAQEVQARLKGFLNKYGESDPILGGAFYTNGAYFMTDTGFKAGDTYQNYNFYSDYAIIFDKAMSKSHERHQNDTFENTGRVISLYAVWKANTYAIEFDINNVKGDTFYADYTENVNGDKLFAYDFTSDKIGFKSKTVSGCVNGCSTVNSHGCSTSNPCKQVRDCGCSTSTLLCYITFDTNYWYSLTGTGDILMYSAPNSDVYGISNLTYTDTKQSKLAVDMFGYSWLGWYYTKEAYLNQNASTNNISVYDDTLVFDSYYSSKLNNTGDELPTFNKKFLEKMNEKGTVFEFDKASSPNTKQFVYYGMHKTPQSGLSVVDGYVCFYNYSQTGVDNGHPSTGFTLPDGSSFDGVLTCDYLNQFKVTEGANPTINYSGQYSDSIILSYYDTFLSANSYKVTKTGNWYSLKLSTTYSDVRRLKLFANWSQNQYNLVFDSLDATSTFYQFGSSTAHNMGGFADGKIVWFNSTDMAEYLLDKLQPTRIGYDFVGWSYNFIPEGSSYSSLASTVNLASAYSFLNKDLLASYAMLNGAANTSDLESNILMINGDRIDYGPASDWILNYSGMAERLGDGEWDGSTIKTRYVYLFPVWRAQTFSINISLNITKEQLSNMHERDSSFALALYNSSDTTCTSSTGVNSKYYTFNTTTVSNKDSSDVSNYYFYYNDVVANVVFEIEFDKPINTATCSFGGKTYALKDLMMTSAGYYFLGLMIDDEYTNDNDYIVKNVLRTTLELNSGLVHHEDDHSIKSDADYDTHITYKQDSGEDIVFNQTLYNQFYNSRYEGDNSISTITSANKLANIDYIDPYSLGYKNSSNFGYIKFNAYKYNSTATMARSFSIMSEREGNEYYLYIIHNNIKYYVVYYESGTSSFKDVITSDKTFLYYNIKDAAGNVQNKYVIHFDNSGKAYYVDNSFNNRKIVNLSIALYTAKTNKLNIGVSALGSTLLGYSEIQKDGSLTGGLNGTNIQVIGQGGFTLVTRTTREITLYAHWEVRDITTSVLNGNNGQGVQSSDNNEGLAGWYELTNHDTHSTSTSVDKSQEGIEETFTFYSDVDYLIRPYFAGRYLSELKIEFDTLVEETAGDTATFRMRHNTLTLIYAWDNVNFKIYVSSITLNGSLLSTSANLSVMSETGYDMNTLQGIDILSFIDRYSINDTSNGSRFDLYERTESGATIENDDYTNNVKFSLKNIMASVKFTCKFAIQTYQVEIYNVVSSSDLSEANETPFSTIDLMHLSSNYVVDNRGLYGEPFISNLDKTGVIPRISTDCSHTQIVTYNVPFYYFITETNYDSQINDIYADTKGAYGFDYLYGTGGYYTNISTNSKIQGIYNGALATNNLKLDSRYEHKGWYTDPDESGALVTLQQYQQGKPIVKNTIIYGYYTQADVATKVIFYYWDSTVNGYVQYLNNQSDYTIQNGYSNDCIDATGTNVKIKKLPSPSIAPWYGEGNKQFIGYIYLDSSVVGSLARKNVNKTYDSLQYHATNSYNGTDGDIFSALSLNKFIPNTETSGGAESTYKDYWNKLSISRLLSYRFEVYDCKYFTNEAEVDGITVKVLDSARFKVVLDDRYYTDGGYFVYKDLKFLNASTQIVRGSTVHAIPIYEEIKLEINDIYGKSSSQTKTKITITSNTNMIHSTVFETGSQYTIYYDPKDVKIAIYGNANLTIPQLTTLSASVLEKYKLDLIPKFTTSGASNQYFDYCKKVIELTGTKYVYLYYNKYGSNSDNPFYMSDAHEIPAGYNNTSVLIDMFFSPLEIALDEDNVLIYEIVSEYIDDKYPITTKEVENTNRKRLMYIMLQLSQLSSDFLEQRISKDPPIYFTENGTKPNIVSSHNFSVGACIDAINYHIKNITDSNVAHKIYYDEFSLFRLAYSIAYAFTTDQKINDGAGLSELFGKNNWTDKYAGYDDLVTATMKETSSTALGPGDFLKSDRVKKTVNDVLGSDKTIYVENTSQGDEEYAMFIGKINGVIYYFDFNGQIQTATIYDDESSRNDGKEYFTHQMETGYYHINPEGHDGRQKIGIWNTSLQGNQTLNVYNARNGDYFALYSGITSGVITNITDIPHKSSLVKLVYYEGHFYNIYEKQIQEYKDLTYLSYRNWDSIPDSIMKPAEWGVDGYSAPSDYGAVSGLVSKNYQISYYSNSLGDTSIKQFTPLTKYSIVQNGDKYNLEDENGRIVYGPFYFYEQGKDYYKYECTTSSKSTGFYSSNIQVTPAYTNGEYFKYNGSESFTVGSSQYSLMYYNGYYYNIYDSAVSQYKSYDLETWKYNGGFQYNYVPDYEKIIKNIIDNKKVVYTISTGEQREQTLNMVYRYVLSESGDGSKMFTLYKERISDGYFDTNFNIGNFKYTIQGVHCYEGGDIVSSGAGYDDNGNYWIIGGYGKNLKVFTRWKSFFNTATQGKLVNYTSAVDMPSVGGAVNPEDIVTPLTFELNSTYKIYFMNASAQLDSNDIDYGKNLVLLKVALQIRQLNPITWDDGYHYYMIGGKDKYNTTHANHGEKAFYDLEDCIDNLNKIGNGELSAGGYRHYTDCFGFMRLSYSIAAYHFDSENPANVSGLGSVYTSKYEGHTPGGYGGSEMKNPDDISKLKPGCAIYDRITYTSDGEPYGGNRHVAMYLYTKENGEIVYLDQSWTITDATYEFVANVNEFPVVSGTYSNFYAIRSESGYIFNTYNNYL